MECCVEVAGLTAKNEKAREEDVLRWTSERVEQFWSKVDRKRRVECWE